MARFAPGGPIDAVAGELELPGRAQQRRPVGIGDGALAGVRAVNAHIDRLRNKIAPAPVSCMISAINHDLGQRGRNPRRHVHYVSTICFNGHRSVLSG
jgi:hypothetical protein